MGFIVDTLRQNPELAIFLTLGVGYWFGKLRVGKFTLGSVTGVLLAGILVGQLDITISAQVKSVFFIMFLFAVGYGVGPQFVQGLARDGGPQAPVAVLIRLLCLGAAEDHPDNPGGESLATLSLALLSEPGFCCRLVDESNNQGARCEARRNTRRW